MKGYTNFDQSAFLCSHGIDPVTADAYIIGMKEYHLIKEGDTFPRISREFSKGYCIPCWSAFALFDTLPETITVDDKEYTLKLTKRKIVYSRSETDVLVVSDITTKSNVISAIINIIALLKLRGIGLF